MQTQLARKIATLGPSLILAAVLPLLLVTPVAAIGVLDLAWTEPTTNVDGTALTDLEKYRVYFGASSGPCPVSLSVEVHSSTASPTGMEVTYQLRGLIAGGTYFVQVTAVDTIGNESVCSNEASGPAKDNPGTTPIAAGGGGGGCFIATAAFGSPLAPQVQRLRDFRDRYFLPYRAGRTFVALYYEVSPPIADIIAGSATVRAMVRVGLLPVLAWAALVLWSPPLGLATLLLIVGLFLWLTLRLLRHLRTSQLPTNRPSSPSP